MKDAIIPGLLHLLQNVVPEGGEPPVEHKHFHIMLDPQIPAQHIKQVRIAAMAVHQQHFGEPVAADRFA
ncbi:hypothetical protein D3C87_2189130 [compost metagenome]